uniref:Uncharacterized protein n=1 Tax=Caenorhabditis japonica TaxID=281687 RepID=A0A8R1HXN5_CAEJA
MAAPLVSTFKIELDLLNKDAVFDTSLKEHYSCSKYVTRGVETLRLTHARILELDASNHNKIIGNHLCTFTKPPVDTLYKTDCQYNGVATFNNFVLMISVTAIKPMLLGQIEYRYSNKVMQLEQFMAPSQLKDAKFNHEHHIIPIRIKLVGANGKNREIKFSKCHDVYPSSMINDHGLFAFVWDEKKASTLGWNRMYFDPAGLGESVMV